MTLNEARPLQFCGPGAKECEKFVAAVIKHAYDQGKPQDDAWIADFAAACLAEDALRWWSELDEEIQGSWKLLRRALFSRYRPLFYGHSGEEAEQFVFSVRQRISDAGKQKDNEWIITFVSGCFVGDALRWHVSLDSRTREDWKSLEVAILAQYARDGHSGSVLKMPECALAPAPPPKAKSRGRIRVFLKRKKHNHIALYLSKNPSNCGIPYTNSMAGALEVEYNPSATSPQTLVIPKGQIHHFDVLGAQWWDQNTAKPGSSATLCAVNLKTGRNSLGAERSGPQMTSIWSIASTPADATQLLQVTVTYGEDSLVLCTDESVAFMWFKIESNSRYRDDDVDIFFEPL